MIHSSAGRSKALIRLTMVVAILVAGCSSYQDLVDSTRGYTARLSRDASVCVATPKDASIVYSPGKSGDTGGTYPESGQTAASIIAKAFAKHASKVEVVPEMRSLAEAMKRAKADGFRVLVWPTLISWTEVSERRRDQIEVKMVLYDTAERKALDTVTIRAKSVKSALSTPTELLTEPVSEYVNSLYLGS